VDTNRAHLSCVARANGVCTHRVAWVDQTPLTDGHPHQERCWEVSGLGGGQADEAPGVEDIHE